MVIDNRKDQKSDTGLLELAYHQNLPRLPTYLGMSLCVRGKQLFKLRKHKNRGDLDNQNTSKSQENKNMDIFNKYIPVKMSSTTYSGPVIHDLIDELNSLNDNGVDFVPTSSLNAKGIKSYSDKSETVSFF